MGRSFHLGTFSGIPVFLHWTFLLLLGFVAVSQLLGSGSPGQAVYGVLFVAAIFGCVVLHEFGHALAARRFGIGTRDVTLLPIGGVARLDRMPDDPRQELVVALAGPAVNVAIAGALGIWLFLSGSASGGAPSWIGGSFTAQLMSVNLALVLFNLLPAFPMDGGRVLRALLARRIGHLRATGTAATIGRGIAVVFGVVGLLWNPMLVLIAVFVWFGAGQEAEMARRRAAFGRRSRWYHPEEFDIDGFDRGDAGPRIVDVGRPASRGRVYRVGPWLVYRDEWVRRD
jgi:Zn-dependent protease